jgi:hypothetical protein
MAYGVVEYWRVGITARSPVETLFKLDAHVKSAFTWI